MKAHICTYMNMDKCTCTHMYTYTYMHTYTHTNMCCSKIYKIFSDYDLEMNKNKKKYSPSSMKLGWLYDSKSLLSVIM